MTSKNSQLKFGAYKFERVQWSRIKPFEKKNSGLGAPNFPIKIIRGPNFIIARVANLPIAPSKGPQINVPLRHQGAQFPVFLIRSFSSPQFPHCFIRSFQFPHCIKREKGPKCSIAPSRASNFIIMS